MKHLLLTASLLMVIIMFVGATKGKTTLTQLFKAMPIVMQKLLKLLQLIQCKPTVFLPHRLQRPHVYLPVHLYGQLVHHKTGCHLLEAQVRKFNVTDSNKVIIKCYTLFTIFSIYLLKITDSELCSIIHATRQFDLAYPSLTP